MKKEITILMLAFAVIAIMAGSAVSQDWAIKGNHTESCCCDVACPCVFGSPPTMGHCEGNSLLEIKEGHYEDISLDGISVVFTGRVGEWVKYYVSEDATDEQVKAVEPLMAKLFEYHADMKVLSIEKAPVQVERTVTKVNFSVPASTVEIELMKGRDGKPIKIQNLAPSYLIDHTQYKSITLSHKSKDKEFSYSGTNGLTSRIEASSKVTTEK